MPAIAMADIDALPDVLGAYRFELLMSAPQNQLAMKDLCLRCQSVALPGSDIENMPVGLNGYTFNYRGRKIWSGILAATFIETNDGIAWKHLKNWQEQVVGTASGNGLSKKEYVSANTLLNVYNEQGNNPAMFAQIFNLWPQSVPDLQLDGQSSTPVTITVTFQYDWCEYMDVDPL